MKDDKNKKPKIHTMILLLAVSFAVLTILSYAGSRGAYSTYAKETNLLKEPALSLFFRGLHDGVLPWSGEDERKDPVNEDRAASAFFFRIGEPGEAALAWEESLDEAEETEETEEAGTEEEEAPFEIGQAPDRYFSDALFVGDSRTDGLAMYSSLKQEAEFASKTSLSIYHLFDWRLIHRTPAGQKGERLLTEILAEKQYKKVYLSVGINELGTSLSNYLEAFRKAVETIRSLQPDAVIYVEAIMRVTERKSASDGTINNPNIAERNQALSALAEEEEDFYIDMNEAVCSDGVNLDAGLTNDGVHLKASEYEHWVGFLRSHAVIRPEDRGFRVPRRH
ncbi:MAG: hypothetical protein II754_01275 [Lachnospiraceae bacterium]|nr:hypothetical protein [Lachnospiraceae bacterium]